MKKVIGDKNFLFLILIFVVYGVIGISGQESVTAVISRIVVMTLLALSFNVQFGFSGMVSLGHSIFFGAGGYSIVLLMSKTSIPLLPAVLLSLLICCVIAVFIGIVCLKNPAAFTFLSYGLALAILTAVGKWLWAGGTVGVTYQPLPQSLTGYRTVFFIIWIVAFVCCILLFLLTKTPFAQMMLGNRENEERLLFLGINTQRLKLVIFTISAMFASVAGMIYTFRNSGAYLSSLDTSISFQVIIMCVLGGSAAFSGPIVGALLITFIYNYISTVFPYYEGLMGVIILLIVFFLREGLISSASPLMKIFGRKGGAR